MLDAVYNHLMEIYITLKVKDQILKVNSHEYLYKDITEHYKITIMS